MSVNQYIYSSITARTHFKISSFVRAFESQKRIESNQIKLL